MFSCLLSLCFVSSIYINGSIGVQNYPWPEEDILYHYRSNHYGKALGRISAVIELNSGIYVEASHTSGLNIDEPDYGLNSLMIGFKVNLWESTK